MHTVDIRSQLKDATLFKEEAFIDGKWIKSKNSFEVTNPATDDVIATVANLETHNAELAIAAAEKPCQRGAINWPKNALKLCANGLTSLLKIHKT